MFRFRFSLLALLVLTSACCLSLGWLCRPRPYVVEALFRVSLSPEPWWTPAHTITVEASEAWWRTQISWNKSDAVIRAALRDPEVAKLDTIRRRTDPAKWLKGRLELDFSNDSKIVSIRLRGKEESISSQTAQLADIALLDAICQAYLNDIVFADRIWRQRTREVLLTIMNKMRRDLRTVETSAEHARNAATLTEVQIGGSHALTTMLQQLALVMESWPIELYGFRSIQLMQSAQARSE